MYGVIRTLKTWCLNTLHQRWFDPDHNHPHFVPCLLQPCFNEHMCTYCRGSHGGNLRVVHAIATVADDASEAGGIVALLPVKHRKTAQAHAQRLSLICSEWLEYFLDSAGSVMIYACRRIAMTCQVLSFPSKSYYSIT